MKLYLSSYKLGNEVEKLKKLLGHGKIAYISNALDSVKDTNWLNEFVAYDIQELTNANLDVEKLDLRNYFGKENELRDKLNNLSGIWVSGGNVFVLRQAMKLSGLDKIIKEFRSRPDFVYGGYSAGACVLSPSLKGYEIVDDPQNQPYELKETIWDGLGLIDYVFVPHFKSNHPESADIDKEIEYLQKNNIPFKALRDGEVLIMEF